MVDNQINSYRFPRLDNANFSPSKMKLVLFQPTHLYFQPKKETPDLRGNTTQVNIALYLITHAVGLCLAAFAYGSAGE